MTETSAGWEEVAAEWTEFARSGADVLYPRNAETFLRALPPPGRLTIDVGCGEGRIVRRLREAGHRVVGVDPAPSLVALAQEADPAGDYRVADASRLPFDDGEADLVVSFMTLHDVRDLPGACREAHRVVRRAGDFFFAIIHPVASGGDFDSPGSDARFVVDAYFPAREIKRPLFDREVTQYHRPLQSYVEALRTAGFQLAQLVELPTERRAAGRVPMFAHLHAVAL